MAITVTPLLTLFAGAGNNSDCDSATNWSAGTVDTGVYKQGTGSLGISVSNTTSAVLLYTCTSVDLTTSNRHVYAWMNSLSLLDTKANGGLRIIVGSDASNYSTWYVAGSDTYPGGWQCFVVDPTSTPTATTGSPNMAAVTRVGVQFKTIRAVKAGLINCFWDAVRYGTGLQITSASTDTITFDDIFNQDDATANAYGIVGKINGVYFTQGEMIFGSTTAGQHISFSDQSQLVVFRANEFVKTGLYTLSVVGNSTGTIKFQLGSKSGTAGIQGCTIRSAGTTAAEKFLLTATDTNIDELKLYGSTFLDASTISLPASASGREVLNCNFESCGQVLPSTCTIRNCNFIGTSSTDSSFLWNTSGDIEDCNFIANTTGPAIEHDTWNGTASGTATNSGSETTTLYDTGASFLTTVSVNDYVYNETDLSFGRVTTVNSNTQITHTALQGGTNNFWTTSNAYSIATAYSYTDLTFSGNTYDVDNTTSPSNVVAISKAGTSNPSTYPSGDFVVIQGSVTVQVHVVDIDNNDIQTAQTAVYLTSDDTVVLNADTNASGIASTTYAGTTPAACYIRVRKSSTGDTKYVANSTTGTIAAGTGLDVTVVLREDTNA